MHSTDVTGRFVGLRTILAKRYGPFSLGQWCLLVLIPLVLYTFRLSGSRVLTDHEILMAAPVKQMLQSGDWLLPRIGDKLWLEKPPGPRACVQTSRRTRARWLAAHSACSVLNAVLSRPTRKKLR